MKRTIMGLILSVALAGAALAQQGGVWLQVEAQPTLGQAQERVSDYAGRLEDVSGWSLSSGWYGIAIGPYDEDDARALLRRLRARGEIPPDSFIVTGEQFRQQFWPVGTGVPTTAQPLPGEVPQDDEAVEALAGPDTETPPESETVALPEPEPQETLREAQIAEAGLSREEKQQLQIALEWAGFYDSAIDGLFGGGTRRAMIAWQDSRGYEATGVLTTSQRAELIADYNSVLDGLDLRRVRDRQAGIAMQMPRGVVAFDRYAPPFAHYASTDPEIGAEVILISQEGDQDRLFGLYEIMQTLEIVPLDGPRERTPTGFTIEGVDDRIHSYTTATLQDGEIKGFTLVWPAGDEERRTRLLAEMQASFTTFPGTIDPSLAPPAEEQSLDFVSGLAIRRPDAVRSGFYVNRDGAVVTTAEAVAECREVTIDSADAEVVHRDDVLGLAVLRPEDALAPIGVATFQTGVPRIQAEVAVAGFPFGTALAAPAVTFGTLADIRGLNGEEELKRLALEASEGDAGGPVFDDAGAVLGMLLPRSMTGERVLPADVSLSVDAETIVGVLQEAGISARTTDRGRPLTPEALARRAADVTAMVSCWN